jgi:hypothetical protein
MAWDRSRGKLWICNSDADVYLADLATQTQTFAFESQGCIDGLAYDGTDDTIWSSDDAASSVQHYKTDGTLIDSKDVSGLLGGCGNSGIAVGGSSLLLANNGCEQIYLAPKDLSSASLFGTYSARLEDLECDDLTFGSAGKAAIWSKDAYDSTLNAFELNPGTCGFGGLPPSSSTDRRVASKANEPSMAVNPRDSRDILIGYNATASDGESVTCGYARSLDGGEHWSYGRLAQPAGLQYGLGDPSVGFAANGRAYLSCLSGADADVPILSRVDASALVVATAPAGSVTFGTPVIVTQDYVQHKIFKKNDFIVGSQLDQEHIAVSPVTGQVFMCYTEYSYGKGSLERRTNLVYALNTSATLWSDPQLISSAREDQTLGCTVAVTGSGRIWVAYWNIVDDTARAVWSDTNGRRWSKPQTLGAKTITHGIDDEVVGRRVNIAADPNPGSTRAVAAWASTDTTGSRAAVKLVSTDSTTWSTARSVSDPSAVITRQPALAFGADGKLALGYYNQTGGIVTYNLGQSVWPGMAPFTFHAAASAPSQAEIDFDTEPLAPRLGDYTAVAEADGAALASWSDDRAGDQMEVWFGG